MVAISRSVDLLGNLELSFKDTWIDSFSFITESLKNEVPSIDIIAVDLSDWKATEEALKNVGPIDLLVNNAGLAILEPITEVSENSIDRYKVPYYLWL